MNKPYLVTTPSYSVLVHATSEDGAIVASYNQAGHAEACIADLATSLDTTQEAICKDLTASEVLRVWVEVVYNGDDGDVFIACKTYKISEVDFTEVGYCRLLQDTWDTKVLRGIGREEMFDYQITAWAVPREGSKAKLLSANAYDLD